MVAQLKQYKKLFEFENIDLSFDEKALVLIVEKASELKLGARGLRAICEAIMTDAMFELPSDTSVKELKVTHNYAASKLDKIDIKKLKVA